jgi:hypothetical protein
MACERDIFSCIFFADGAEEDARRGLGAHDGVSVVTRLMAGKA